MPEGHSLLVEADLDEAEMQRQAELEIAVENARLTLSQSLHLPRAIPARDRLARMRVVDELLMAAGHALALGEAAHRLSDHLMDRARRLLGEGRKEAADDRPAT